MSTIDRAIEILAKKITEDTEAHEVLKYTQAAQNLAHTKLTLAECERVTSAKSEQE